MRGGEEAADGIRAARVVGAERVTCRATMRRRCGGRARRPCRSRGSGSGRCSRRRGLVAAPQRVEHVGDHRRRAGRRRWGRSRSRRRAPAAGTAGAPRASARVVGRVVDGDAGEPRRRARVSASMGTSPSGVANASTLGAASPRSGTRGRARAARPATTSRVRRATTRSRSPQSAPSTRSPACGATIAFGGRSSQARRREDGVDSVGEPSCGRPDRRCPRPRRADAASRVTTHRQSARRTGTRVRPTCRAVRRSGRGAAPHGGSGRRR